MNRGSFFKELYYRSRTALVLLASIAFIYYSMPPIFFSCLLGGALLFALSREWGPHVLRPAYTYYQTTCRASPTRFISHTIPDRYRWPVYFSFMTPLYPILPFIMLIWLSRTMRFIFIPLIIIVTVHDTSAYIIGKLIGTHHCAPTISPHKSWEGLIGGLSATGIVIFFLNLWYSLHLSLTTLTVISITMSAACGTGDLFESWIKRKLAIKDFGSLFPGHGGVLDRCDALLCAGSVTLLFRSYVSSLFSS